ncbi:MAG: N-6 DNA methylase [Kiritimatiellae bacterium]|nr:N-6 DNA methylase [Kiritimatiellia bacterium]
MCARRKTKSTQPGTKNAESAFKAIDDLLRGSGGGCSGSLEYMEQSSWLLFLRYLDAQEENRRLTAEMQGTAYAPALPEDLSWHSWAWPAKPDGSFDLDRSLKGDDLLDFVKGTLFPRLKALGDDPAATPLQVRIASIFSELTCRFTSGYTLREVIDLIQPLKFQTNEDRHEMSVLYENRLREMGNAGRDGGQYYTPRPLIRTMIRILAPKLGETFYDGACGSGGFLCEAFNYLQETAPNTADAWNTLQHETFYGGENKSLAYMTAQMNCILHGLESPNIHFGSSLKQNPGALTDDDRVNVIGANPPFGAKVEQGEKENFVTRSSESAYLFMEHFIAKLKEGGRAAIIVKNTLLSNTDNASKYIRQQLLERCSLDMILDLPQKVFAAGVKAVVLFFRKGGPTTKPIQYYELDLQGVSLGKTRPLKESDLAEFEAIATGQKSGEGVPSFWTVDPATINPESFDLSVKNPNKKAEIRASSAQYRADIKAAAAEIAEIIKDW